MTVLKQVERSATVAFCPHANLLAMGTVAGAIDMSFSTSSVLEVYRVDFASSAPALQPTGSAQAPERFNRLAWGPRDAAHAHGILAGGLADGSVVLWDPTAIVDPKARADGKPALLAKMQKHTGAVKGLEFNTFSPNLLASGAADGDLCIWDVAKPAAPSMYPPLKGTVAGPGNEITHIAWNRKVQHILASTIANGTTVVWDLKRQKPVISFKDPNSLRRASILQWNPEVATQLVVASDDDRSPTLQMWDLRNSVSPLKEFVGHTKGVLGMAWSPHDPSLLLSAGKDARTICWDVSSAGGDIVCEYPASNPANWAFDVAWCPGEPGVFATASFDGRVSLHNLAQCTLGKLVETVHADFSVSHEPSGESMPLRKAPAWMRRPAGASFGFGGKLVSFANHKTQTTDASGQPHIRSQGHVTVGQLVTEHDLIGRSEAFEAAIAGGDRQTLHSYCENKATAAGAEEGEVWSFLGLLFESDGRRELLRRLGFGDAMAPEPSPETAAQGDAQGTADGVAAGVEAMALSGVGAVAGASGGGAPEDFFEQHDEEFFDKLPDQDATAAASPGHATPPTASPKKPSGALSDHDAAHGPDASAEAEEEVQRALVAGNYELAVEACFKANRLADALLIANIFNSDLYKRTMHRYMKRHPKPYMQIVRANVEQDWATLVRTRPVGQWRETLALLATYTAQEDWATLCDSLAQRLSAAAMHHAASLCYICAGNLDQAVAFWSKGAAGSKEAMQAVIEKSVIFGLATGTRKGSAALSDLVTAYASLLASQGRLTTALEYLEYVPGEASTTVAVLKDRIFRSGAPLPQGAHAPPFPFILEDVRPVVAEAPPPAASTTAGQYNGYGAQPQAQQAQQQQQQQQWGGGYAQAQPAAATGYGAAQGAAGAGAYGQPQQAAAAGYGQAGAYGQPAAAAACAQPAAAATGYGQPAATGAGGYAQPAAAAGAYGAQPAAYGAAAAHRPAAAAAPTAAAPSAYGAGAGAYGASAATNATAPTAYGAAPAATMSAWPGQGAGAGGYGTAAAAPAGGYGGGAVAAYTDPSAGQGAVYTARKTAAPPASTTTAGVDAGAAKPSVYAAYGAGTGAQPAPMAGYAGAGAYGGAPGAYGAAPAAAMAAPAPAPPPPASATARFTPTTTDTASKAAAAAPLAPSGGSGAFPGYGAAAAAPSAPMGGAMGMPYGGAAAAAPPPPAAPAAPAAPAGPPANTSIQTVDTSAVPAEYKGVVASLTNLYNSCMPLANNPMKKREMEDNTRKVGQLFWRLNAGQVSAGVLPKLQQLCAAIDAGDMHTANHLQVQMTTTDWDECGFWLGAVKRMIKMRTQPM